MIKDNVWFYFMFLHDACLYFFSLKSNTQKLDDEFIKTQPNPNKVY